VTVAQSIEIVVGRTKIRLQKKGDNGPTVVFLHGAGGVPAWSPFFDSLAEGRQLLVPDHPGFGASADAEWLRNVPDVAMFYLDLLDQLNLKGVHLIGHSLGGWIAAEIAIRNEARLKSLTLISAAGIRLKGCPMGDIFIWSPEEAVRNLYHDQGFADRQLAQQPTAEQLDVLVRNRFAFAKLAWEPRGFNPSLEKWLHRITVKTQILWGMQDKVIPAAYATHWARCVPKSKVRLIDDCGHLPQTEKASVAAQLVGEHLSEATS
jgi:pimeloyl-ACP methyl ester carboxylesterase